MPQPPAAPLPGCSGGSPPSQPGTAFRRGSHGRLSPQLRKRPGGPAVEPPRMRSHRLPLRAFTTPSSPNVDAAWDGRAFFPVANSHRQGRLQASPLHSVYYEVFGNPAGRPALFLHGGPGAGCTKNHARFFDPEHFRVVLVDQRGCGASSPRGCLEDNDTWALVADLEALRAELGVDRYMSTWRVYQSSEVKLI
eukprot:SM003983S15178  [mRNA]  locus=s3983:178:1276:+ [translate_table: standard]